MGIRSTLEVESGSLPPFLQIAAPKTEPAPALPPPALSVHPPDDPNDVDDLTPPLKGGRAEIIQDPD